MASCRETSNFLRHSDRSFWLSLIENRPGVSGLAVCRELIHVCIMNERLVKP